MFKHGSAVGSIATSQLQDPQFEPEFALLSVWHFCARSHSVLWIPCILPTTLKHVSRCTLGVNEWVNVCVH